MNKRMRGWEGEGVKGLEDITTDRNIIMTVQKAKIKRI